MYSNWRNFPYSLDGLKPVERRILFSAFQIARQKFTKSARIDGHVIGNYHPHGSVYGSIVQMVKQGFLEGQGNFGSNIGVEPVGAAASRYTEIRMHPKTIELAFQYVKFVPWITNELDQKEPLYLPVMFPMCLLGNEYTQGIGFGFKTYSPCYKLEDLVKRLEYLLGIRKRKVIISPVTDCEILSGQDVLEELLTTGKAKVDVKGIIEANSRTNVAILRSWPPGKKFETILKKFSAQMITGAVGYTDLSAKNKTEIVFKVLRERGRDAVFNEFISNLEEAVTASISFETTVIDNNNNVQVMGIDTMLQKTFESFKDANEKMLVHQISETKLKIDEAKLLEQIADQLRNNPEFTNGTLPYETSVSYIAERLKLTQKVVKDLLDKYKIRKLMTISFDTGDLITKLAELEKTLQNSQEFVMAQYGRI